MNIYDAIMAAADHIERNPRQFAFHSTVVPDCDTPGCALGWIAAYKGHKVESTDEGQERACFSDEGDPVGVMSMQFYRRMEAICGSKEWSQDASLCAQTLRAYAQKYHAPQTPDWEALAKPDAGFRQEVSA